MEDIKKQAIKLREQVAKQQQVRFFSFFVFKLFRLLISEISRFYLFFISFLWFVQAVLKHLLHLGIENVAVDEAEIECHQQLQNLYNSTRAAKAPSSFS